MAQEHGKLLEQREKDKANAVKEKIMNNYSPGKYVNYKTQVK